MSKPIIDYEISKLDPGKDAEEIAELKTRQAIVGKQLAELKHRRFMANTGPKEELAQLIEKIEAEEAEIEARYTTDRDQAAEELESRKEQSQIRRDAKLNTAIEAIQIQARKWISRWSANTAAEIETIIAKHERASAVYFDDDDTSDNWQTGYKTGYKAGYGAGYAKGSRSPAAAKHGQNPGARGRPPKYCFHEMEIGDKEFTSETDNKKVYNASRVWASKNFPARKFQVWRVIDTTAPGCMIERVR